MTSLVNGLTNGSYKQWFNKAERTVTGDARPAHRLLEAARAHARTSQDRGSNERSDDGRMPQDALSEPGFCNTDSTDNTDSLGLAEAIFLKLSTRDPKQRANCGGASIK